MPWILAFVAGMLIAVGAVPIVLFVADWYQAWDDVNNPPATLAWNSIERIDSNRLRVKMLVTRHEDCLMVRALGYTEKTLQAMQPADFFGREDGEPPQSYPVGITVVSRPWLLRGVYGDKIAVSAYYDCDNRIVKAPLLIGDVPVFGIKGKHDE